MTAVSFLLHGGSELLLATINTMIVPMKQLHYGVCCLVGPVPWSMSSTLAQLIIQVCEHNCGWCHSSVLVWCMLVCHG